MLLSMLLGQAVSKQFASADFASTRSGALQQRTYLASCATQQDHHAYVALAGPSGRTGAVLELSQLWQVVSVEYRSSSRWKRMT